LASHGSGRLTVRNSKTDQASEGSVFYLSRATMDALSQVRPPSPDSDWSVFRLSPRQINRRIAAAAKAAGVQGDFAGHSPRVGMAIDLAASGCELPAPMTAGRWESPTMPARYTRAEAAGRGRRGQILQTTGSRLRRRRDSLLRGRIANPKLDRGTRLRRAVDCGSHGPWSIHGS